MILPPSEFYKRLTIDEKIALESSTNIQVKIMLREFSLTERINTESQALQDGVRAMVAFGLLSAPRALAVFGVTV